MSTKGSMLMSESVMPPAAAAAGAVWAKAEEMNTGNSKIINQKGQETDNCALYAGLKRNPSDTKPRHSRLRGNDGAG
jgi:hypothetical protein